MATFNRRIPLSMLTTALAAGLPLCAGQGGLTRLPPSAIVQLQAEESSRADAAREHLMAQRAELGLDEAHAFKQRGVHTDELGQTHVRFQQQYNGVRVWGGDVVTHQDAGRSHLAPTPNLFKNIRVNVRPSLSATEALAIAHESLAPMGGYAYEPTVELVIYPEAGQVVKASRRAVDYDQLNAEDFETRVLRHTLAYHVHTMLTNDADGVKQTDYIINAHTGAILKTWDDLHSSDANGSGKSQYSGTVTLKTNSTSNGYELKDLSRGMQHTTYNMNNATGSGTGTLYTDADNTWGDGSNYSGGSTTSDNGQTAAVDAHFGAEMSYDFYKSLFNRNGIDGNGKAAYSRVHYDSRYDNAFWDDSCFCMTYGDGSSFTSLTALDVAGHEMSHGVCANTAALVYSGESGGLNESNSDIHGNMIELFASNGGSLPSTVSNTNGCWRVGEQLRSTPLRWMYKPNKDNSSPDAYSSSIGNLDVHYSSGPNNRMFFFLSQGSSASSDDYYTSYLPSGMTGIGPEKAVRVWYRALSVYMNSNTNYAAARTACLSAAKDLYGDTSAEYYAVMNAYHGINVGAAAPSTPPAGTVSATASESGSSGTVTFSVKATASSSSASINKVEYYLDGASSAAATSTTSPFSVTYDSTKLSDGSHSLVAKAYDSANQNGSSPSISFTVNNGGGGGTTTQVLTNPGFESGATGWGGTTGAIGNWSAYGQAAHGGSKVCWLDGNGSSATETIAQSVTIPSAATAAALSFWLHIDTAETDPVVYDTLKVQVRNSSGSVLATLATYSNRDAASGYVQKTFNLSAYKGQTVQIYLVGVEDQSLQTSFVVDDFALNVTK